MNARVAARWWVGALVQTLLVAQGPPDWLLDTAAYPARATRSEGELTLDNGILRVCIRLEPDAAIVSLELGPQREQLLRAPAPFAILVVDGKECRVGGLIGPSNRAFLMSESISSLTADPTAFHCRGVELLPLRERFPWPEAARRRATSVPVAWPPRGAHAVLHFEPPAGGETDLRVDVHVELYDGLPLYSQWFEVHNVGASPHELDRFTALQWAMVEAESRVEPERLGVRLPSVHVETDFAFHAMTGADGSSHCVRWLPDPSYETQVNYERKTRCRLEVGPDLGPAQTIAKGGSWASFRTFVLCHGEDHDRDRESLALRRMYRQLAPWCLENPLMLHLRTAEPTAVRTAIEQCAAVGFEMVILSFGSGFDIEDDSEENLARWRQLADYAHSNGVQIGGYSLLSSRKIEPELDNCVNLETGKPGGQVFGYAPALASAWGQRYFAKLRRFFEYTGFDLLEHDGSYPGDADAMARPPLQKGHADSQWVQHAILTDFYRWCRGRGIYLNVPDWYFFNGSNKTGMGYRETNWSLPREQQVLHARQNLFDGTRHKTPSMGWMFVPLTEYHGGGDAATIEPLAQHHEHYGRMLASNLGYGAQACWRGPRLYDTDATRALVALWVTRYLEHRRVLEADVVHGSSRRADGRWLDWVVHADPGGPEPGLLAVWNPTAADLEAVLPLRLATTGLRQRAMVHAVAVDLPVAELAIDGMGGAMLPVRVAAGDCRWYALLPAAPR